MRVSYLISRAPNSKDPLTHWGRVTHICVSNLTTIGSANGLSPGRRQAITWTNAGILLIGSLGTNFSEILIEISTFSFKKMRLKVSSCLSSPVPNGPSLVSHAWLSGDPVETGSLRSSSSKKYITWIQDFRSGANSGISTQAIPEINWKDYLKYDQIVDKLTARFETKDLTGIRQTEPVGG